MQNLEGGRFWLEMVFLLGTHCLHGPVGLSLPQTFLGLKNSTQL